MRLNSGVVMGDVPTNVEAGRVKPRVDELLTVPGEDSSRVGVEREDEQGVAAVQAADADFSLEEGPNAQPLRPPDPLRDAAGEEVVVCPFGDELDWSMSQDFSPDAPEVVDEGVCNQRGAKRQVLAQADRLRLTINRQGFR